jgi:O-antigen/teichoic acid export membrane protein
MKSVWSRWHVRGWGTTMLDQAVVAVTNFALSVAVGRIAGVRGLAQWGLLLAVALILVGLNRTLLLEPFAASRSESRAVPDAVRWLLLTAGAVAAALTGVVVVFFPAFSGVSPALAVWLVAAFLVQDGGRYLAFKVQKSGRALRSDLSVLVVAILTIALLLALGWRSTNGAILALAAGLTVGAAVNQTWRPRQLGSREAGKWWVTTCSRLAWSLLEDSVAFIMGVQILLFLLAHLATASEVGTTRAVSSLFSPVAVAFTGLSVWLVPHLASRPQASRTRLFQASSVLGVVGLLMLVAATAIGPQMVELMFGRGVSVSRWDVAWGGLAVVAAAASSPILAAVKVANRYGAVAHSRSVAAALAILVLWIWPGMQVAEGYLALVALQGMVVLVAGAWVVTKHHARLTDQPPSTYLSSTEQ